MGSMDGTVLTDAEDEAPVADVVTAAAASNNEHDHDKSAPTCEEVSSRSSNGSAEGMPTKTSPSSTSSNLALLLQRRHALESELRALDEQIRHALIVRGCKTVKGLLRGIWIARDTRVVTLIVHPNKAVQDIGIIAVGSNYRSVALPCFVKNRVEVDLILSQSLKNGMIIVHSQFQQEIQPSVGISRNCGSNTIL